MRIVLDAMGSDDCPEPEFQAAIEAAKLFGDEIILVGPEDRHRGPAEARLAKIRQGKIDPRPGHDHDGRQGPGAGAQEPSAKAQRPRWLLGSIWSKNGEADAFVTAGNTGGALATAYYRLGTIPGVERAGLTGLFPVKNGSVRAGYRSEPGMQAGAPAPIRGDGRVSMPARPPDRQSRGSRCYQTAKKPEKATSLSRRPIRC